MEFYYFRVIGIMKTLFGILFLALVFSFGRSSAQAIDAKDPFYRLLQQKTDSVLVLVFRAVDGYLIRILG